MSMPGRVDGPQHEPRGRRDLHGRQVDHGLLTEAAVHVEVQRAGGGRRAIDVGEHERDLRVAEARAHVLRAVRASCWDRRCSSARMRSGRQGRGRRWARSRPSSTSSSSRPAAAPPVSRPSGRRGRASRRRRRRSASMRRIEVVDVVDPSATKPSPSAHVGNTSASASRPHRSDGRSRLLAGVRPQRDAGHQARVAVRMGLADPFGPDFAGGVRAGLRAR